MFTCSSTEQGAAGRVQSAECLERQRDFYKGVMAETEGQAGLLWRGDGRERDRGAEG